MTPTHNAVKDTSFTLHFFKEVFDFDILETDAKFFKCQ